MPILISPSRRLYLRAAFIHCTVRRDTKSAQFFFFPDQETSILKMFLCRFFSRSLFVFLRAT